MDHKRFRNYYLFACLGVLLASVYPLSMGGRVVSDMIVDGTVLKENYPKYIIPYTPVCVALLVGVLILPICKKLFRRLALLAGSAVSTAVFFAVEILFEKKVVVKTAEIVTTLEDWQMYMCYVPPEDWREAVTSYKTQTPVDILMGNYNPAFKLHFYMISLLLILSVLNCLYDFAHMALSGDKKRLKPLAAQSVASLIFLGLCILACFTAFWRDGNLEVSPLSAALMTAFFLLMGIVGGLYTASFLISRPAGVSVGIPAVVSSVLTALMYLGEMILLHGHLYCLGRGFLFESIPYLVLSLFDLLVILASGCLTALICKLLNRNGEAPQNTEANA